jgi:hypothetical protein
MKNFFWFTLLLLAAFLVTGCGGTNPSPKSLTDTTAVFDPSSGGISGTVVGTDTTTTIAGALVEAAERQTETGSSGTYLLYPLTAGNYQVVARSPGFSPGYQNQVRVLPGKITEEVRIQLGTTGAATAALDLQVFLINPIYGTDGDEILVVGKGFGQSPGRVTVAGKDAIVTGWNTKNDGVIAIRLPTEVESGEVRVTVNGQTSSENPPVKLTARPIALEAKPSAAKAGEKIALLGRNFYPIVSFNKVSLNGKSCVVLPDSTTTQLNVLMPEGAESGTFQVRIETESFQLDGISTAEIAVPPELVFLSPQRSLPGVTLTLTGRNLGTNPAVVRVNIGSNQVIGSSQFLSFGQNQLTFAAPDATIVTPGSSIDISISVQNAVTASWTWTSFLPSSATINSYGIFDFSAVSSGNTLRLARLSPNERLAFVSTLTSSGTEELAGVYAYNATCLLGNNTTPVPTEAQRQAAFSARSNRATARPATDYGPLLRRMARSQPHQLHQMHQTQIRPHIRSPRISRMEAVAPATASFWLVNLASSDPSNTNNDIPVKATLKVTGTKALVYVDDASMANLAASETEQIAAWFDTIYAQLANNATFKVKDPPEGNVDAQAGIVLLLTSQLNNGLSGSRRTISYFNSRDKDLAAIHSAGTEIIYMYDQAYKDTPENFRGAMAHELQHMLYFNQKGTEGVTWLDEGLSLLAQDTVGYGFRQGVAYPVDYVANYLSQPNRVSLNNWPNATDLGPENFGLSYLFLEYVYEQCQGYQAVRSLHTFRTGTFKGLTDLTTNVLPLWNGTIPGVESRLIEFYHQFAAAMYCDETATATIPTQYAFANIVLKGGQAGINGLRRISLDENPVQRKGFEMFGFSCDVIEYANGNDGDVEVTINDVPSSGRFKTWVIYLPQ